MSLQSPSSTQPTLQPQRATAPLFHSATPVRYAQGFVKMLSTLTVAQANALRMRLESHFGHTLYFRLRPGKRLINPTEQAYIRQAMTELSINPLPDFDVYVEAYNW